MVVPGRRSASSSLVLAIPVFSIQLGHIGDGADPKSFTDRRAYDLMAHAFGPGSNGPLTVVIDQTDVPSDERSPLAAQAQKALTDVPGAASVTPLTPTSDGDVLVGTAILEGGTAERGDHRPDQPPQVDETLPQAVSGTDCHGYVTGTTAAQVDFLDIVAAGCR